MLGVTKERAKQLEAKAMLKLQKTEHFDDGKSLLAINHLEVGIYPLLFICHRMKECLGKETRQINRCSKIFHRVVREEFPKL